MPLRSKKPLRERASTRCIFLNSKCPKVDVAPARGRPIGPTQRLAFAPGSATLPGTVLSAVVALYQHSRPYQTLDARWRHA